MLKKVFSSNLAAIISGLLVFIAIGQINFVLGWICFVPLFFSILSKTPKQVFHIGCIFGVTLSCFAYSWIISGAERFTGYNFLYGILVFLACTLVIALYWGLVLWCFSLLKQRAGKYSTLINSVLIAAWFCVSEFLWSLVSEGMPWFHFYAGNSLEGNLYAVQPASIFGTYVLTFVAVLVNFLVACFIAEEKWKKLFIPVAVIAIYMLCGYAIFQSFTNNLSQTKTIKVAVLAENIPPDIKWNDENGNMLVQRLLDLNKAAVAEKPDIILWSEAAVPWTYRKDDDLVNEILKESATSHPTHILGINTEVASNVVNNSAYCILPNGDVMSRYDKQFLLSFIEKPLAGVSIPFFSNKGFLVSDDVEHSVPLQTPFGKAGIMICNEAAIEKPARESTKSGAEFFCNMSNDGWFNDTYIIRSHFLNARLRAVETRKDVVVNCNNGFSGMIDAAGNIVEQQKDTEPFIKMGEIHPNTYQTLTIKFPALFVYLCAAYLLFAVAMRLFKYPSTK